jgi:hypothetical protein
LADIKNRRQFEASLGKQPSEVAVAFAARVALRVLPVVQSAKGGYRGCLVLPVFRATAVSWSTAKYPAHGTELVANAAAAYAAAVVVAADVTVAAATAEPTPSAPPATPATPLSAIFGPRFLLTRRVWRRARRLVTSPGRRFGLTVNQTSSSLYGTN